MNNQRSSTAMLLLKLLAATILSALIAVVLLATRLRDGLEHMNVANGDWSTNISTGSADASATTRAAIALGGLLASTRENSMYYRLDSIDGEPLRLGCRYRISGDDYDADWWSITLYGWDQFLVPNAIDRFSFNNENVFRNADGSWDIVVADTPRSGNWLPAGPASGERGVSSGDFDLLLRLYSPGDAYLLSPETAPLPRVVLEGCE